MNQRKHHFLQGLHGKQRYVETKRLLVEYLTENRQPQTLNQIYVGIGAATNLVVLYEAKRGKMQWDGPPHSVQAWYDLLAEGFVEEWETGYATKRHRIVDKPTKTPKLVLNVVSNVEPTSIDHAVEQLFAAVRRQAEASVQTEILTLKDRIIELENELVHHESTLTEKFFNFKNNDTQNIHN
jgi:hypothetical protein